LSYFYQFFIIHIISYCFKEGLVLKDIQNNKKLLEKLAKVFQDDNVGQYKKYLDDQIKKSFLLF